MGVAFRLCSSYTGKDFSNLLMGSSQVNYKDVVMGVDSFNLVEFRFALYLGKKEGIKKFEGNKYIEIIEDKDQGTISIVTKWIQKVGTERKKKEFFRKIAYNKNYLPNAEIDDHILVMEYLASIKGNKPGFPVSCKEICIVKYPHRNPSKRDIDSVIQNIQALLHAKITTNFIYDLENKSWDEIEESNIVDSWKYKARTKDGKEVIRTRKISNKKGEIRESEETPKYLTYFAFTFSFFEKFVKNNVPINFERYFSCNRIQKNMFRVANKEVYCFEKPYSIDLEEYATRKIGISMKQFENKGKYKFTYLKCNLLKDIRILNKKADTFELSIEKSNTYSGYKLVTRRKKVLSGNIPEAILTDYEIEARNQLLEQKIYLNTANKIITDSRRAVGKNEVKKFISFVLKTFQIWEKSVKELKHSKPAVLARFFYEKESDDSKEKYLSEELLVQFREYTAKNNKVKDTEEFQNSQFKNLLDHFDMNKVVGEVSEDDYL